MNHSKLEQALVLNLDQEISEYEKQLTVEPVHTFSTHYQKKKKRILQWADETVDANTRVPEYRRFRLRRTVLLVAAIVAILIATTTVTAIVRPEIIYIIKEKITNWTITFDNGSTQESAFVYIKPPVPEDFQLIDETKGIDFYYLTYRNGAGQEISYDQNDANSTSISIDSEQVIPEKKYIKGVEVIISEHDGIVQIMYTDNRYVYVIDGNCGKEILLNIVREMIE